MLSTTAEGPAKASTATSACRMPLSTRLHQPPSPSCILFSQYEQLIYNALVRLTWVDCKSLFKSPCWARPPLDHRMVCSIISVR